MKPILLLLLSISITCLSCSGQQTTHDLVSFTPPAGWKMENKGDVLALTSTDNAKHRLCVLTIYKSSDGSGDAATDFTREWNDKAVNRFGVSPNAVNSPGDTKDGWVSRNGADTFTRDGSKLMLLMTTLTGYQKTITLMAIINDKSYLPDLDKFYKSIALAQPQQAQTSGTAGDPSQPSVTTSQPASVSPAASAGLSYTPPQDWQPGATVGNIRSFNSPLLECNDQSYYTLYILGTTTYTGDLQEYAKTIHKSYFYQAGTYFPYPEAGRRVVKGIDDQGREFLSYEGPSYVFKSDNCWHTGLVYLIRSGDKVAACMLELKPVNRDKSGPPSSFTIYFLYSCNPLRAAWNKFLASVRFGDPANKRSCPVEDLVGNWECRVYLGASIWGYTSSIPLQKYHFAEDGRWQSEKMITENNFGKYRVDGDRLVITDGTGKTISYKFKMEKIFEYTTWNRYLTLYDSNGTETKLNYQGE